MSGDAVPLAGSAKDLRKEESVGEKKESCVKHVDALWFCYSPVYQMTQYYREGEFDSCVQKWTDFSDCMLMRTSAAQRIQAKREAQAAALEAGAPPMWTMRTPEAAAPLWEEQFGHLNKSAPHGGGRVHES
eukprot:TRINITY_DN35627_c0_g1_i1.p1 TRINITY_DN35627_c0_g1~~TRINITY_DN35627_c0_g1_i1.p1  ORF type:complete len:131 (-),score=28.03 TRINITY_DN35627_c0_g1_i1:428-820(-)